MRELCSGSPNLSSDSGLHVILQIGACLIAIGAGEQAELRRRHGQRAAPEQCIFGEHAGKAEAR